jgi:NitT/TauT family transport system substrate-binding protein
MPRKTAAAFYVGLGLAAALLTPSRGFAADKITFLTSWFAQAEHGGFYQAKAEGLYEKAGLDATIRMGGPQVNGMQLLLAGEADVMMGYDFQVLKAREQNLPLVTVGTSFQVDVQGLMTHTDVKSLADLKGKSILVATAARTSYWPWLRKAYGLSDDQLRAYTFNLQPFFADPNVEQQGYLTSEPFVAEQQGQKVNYFLFADAGYPPYGTTMVTTDTFVKAHPDVVARFVKATLQGWRDYMNDPSAGNALIKEDNPKMSDAQLAYAVSKLREKHIVDGGDATTLGIGIMTEARWKKTYDFMVDNGLLDAKVNWKAAFDDRFVKDLNIH